MNGKQDKSTMAVVSFLILMAIAFLAMCIVFCIMLIKGAVADGRSGIPMFEAQAALFLAFLALAFAIAVGTPYFISRGKIKRIIDKYVKHEYKLELSNLAEETAKLDSHLSRMTAFFLLEQNYCYWAIGWAFRALKRYGELSKSYADIYREFNTFIIKEIIMSVNFKPLADRVLVEPAPAETKTASGLIIPDTAKEKPQEGVVVAVGNGKKDEPLTVKVGDKVLYGKYAGQELKLDGKDYLIIRESDLLGILG